MENENKLYIALPDYLLVSLYLMFTILGSSALLNSTSFEIITALWISTVGIFKDQNIKEF